MSQATTALGLPAETLTLLLATAFENAVEFGIDLSLGHAYFAMERPGTTETPRQKVVAMLADYYARLTTSPTIVA